MSRRRIFIDPASISSGWAIFEDAKLVDHGTILANKKDNVWERLSYIHGQYELLGADVGPFDAVHIEKIIQTPRVQKAVHWSVGVIGAALSDYADLVDDAIPISSWQKHCEWKEIKHDWNTNKYDSEDEFAAICMGRWYLSRVS